jgi:hypothetical protein
MKTALVSFVLAVTATACASSIEPIEATHVRHVADVEAPAAVEETPAYDLVVWAADARLEAFVRVCAGRIAAATGLLVVTTSEEVDGVPIFWAGRDDVDWWGIAHFDEGGADYLAIHSDTPDELLETVVLHELLHTLGAGHVGSGEGVMSPEIWEAFQLTVADLESVCAEQHCLAFVPEK